MKISAFISSNRKRSKLTDYPWTSDFVPPILRRKFNCKSHRGSGVQRTPQVFVESRRATRHTALHPNVFRKSEEWKCSCVETRKVSKARGGASSNRVGSYPRNDSIILEFPPKSSGADTILSRKRARSLTWFSSRNCRDRDPINRYSLSFPPGRIHFDTCIFFGYRRGDHSALADSFPEPRSRKHADDLGRCPSNRYLWIIYDNYASTHPPPSKRVLSFLFSVSVKYVHITNTVLFLPVVEQWPSIQKATSPENRRGGK